MHKILKKKAPAAPNALDRHDDSIPQPKSTAKPVVPMTRAEYEDIAKPRVLIAGGGIAGLTLASLLYRAGIAVTVLERAKVIMPLGSAITMGAAVIPLFKQLGIYEEFMTRSKAYDGLVMYNEELEPLQTMSWPWLKEYVGHFERIISRPELFTILQGNFPRHRVLLGKRVLSFTQTDRGVDVRCADNSLYHADIIVGADGAYSAVRQIMYKDPEVEQTLSASDAGGLPFRCVCLVGQTIPLDPEDFPDLDERFVKNHFVLGESNMCTWFTVTTAQNSVCWMMIQFMDKELYKKNDNFRMTDWGQDSAEAMAKEIGDFKVPGGRDGVQLTLADYLDKTPERHLTKVVLEEILFEKWYHKRAVLVGDACNKMNPAGGVGAVHAIHGAVTLANWLSTLRCPDEAQLKAAFEEYRKERYPFAKAAAEHSKMFRANLGKNMMSTLIRAVMKRLPVWLWRRMCLKSYLTRPQASFLPLVKDDAKFQPLLQQSLTKTAALLKKIVDDPEVLCTDDPEVLKKAEAKKEAEKARVAAEAEAGLVVHTPIKVSVYDSAASGPVAV
ncbi:hypothetical protein BG004_006018 [Podila humilis]|nr:hypothetical protein BG004_006018 [Podila humilis]